MCCADYPGEGAPALKVDVRAASVEMPRKAPMEGHVVGAIVVVIMIAVITLLAVVVYRFKVGCMSKSKAVSPASVVVVCCIQSCIPLPSSCLGPGGQYPWAHSHAHTYPLPDPTLLPSRILAVFVCVCLPDFFSTMHAHLLQHVLW